MESFKGKFLVRKSKLSTGEPCIILCGAFFPKSALDSFDDKDEMWVGELFVEPYKRFVNHTNHNFTPEDFLENGKDSCQDLAWWQEKKGLLPKIIIVAFDATEYYDSKLVEKCGRIADVYYYNASEVTNCCEVIPSYHLTYVTSHCEKTSDDSDLQVDIYDSLGEANRYTTDMYVHCHEFWQPGFLPF